MALSDDLDDLRGQLDSRPPMVKYGDKPGLTIPNSDMNNNLDTVFVGGDVAIEAARIAMAAGEDAFASRQSAEQSATIASDAATVAVDAKDIVVAAETVVVDAKNAAVQANTDAQEAKDTAVAARDETVAAKDILVPAIDETLEARDQAVAASTTAVGAADTATIKAGEAVVSADLAEFWADAAEASSGVSGLGETIAALPKIKPILNLDFINQKQLLPGVNFSRATPTWDWDEHGNFRKYEIDEPCFAYDPVSGEAKGLQVYPARTNLQIRNNTTDGWILEGEGAELNYVNGEFVLNVGSAATSRARPSYVGDIPAGATFISSANIKTPQSGTIRFYIEESGRVRSPEVRVGEGGVVSSSSSDDEMYGYSYEGNGFYRVWVKHVKVSDSSVVIRSVIGPLISDPAMKITFKNFQVEKGTAPTPYIPTEGSQVTVAATNLQIDGDLFDSVYNPKQGTMLFDVGENYFLTAGGVSPYINLGLLGVGVLSLTGGLGTSGVTLYMRDASGAPVPPNLPLPKRLDAAPQLGNPYKLGIRYTHDQQSVADFGEVATSSRDESGFLENSASRIYVHPYTNGYVKAIKYYNKALPDETLKELTK